MIVTTLTRSSIVLSLEELRSLQNYLEDHCVSCCVDNEADRAVITSAVGDWLRLYMPTVTVEKGTP